MCRSLARHLCLVVLSLAACGSDGGGTGGAAGSAGGAGVGGAGGQGGRGGAGGAGAAGTGGVGGTGGIGGSGGGGSGGSGGSGGTGGVGGSGGSGGTGATVELGAGADAFQPVADGAPLPAMIGPQGSPMIIFALRARGVLPGDPMAPADSDPEGSVVCTDAAGTVMAQGQVKRGMTPGDQSDVFVMPNVWTPIYTGAPSGSLTLHCTATITDSAGHSATDVRSVTASW